MSRSLRTSALLLSLLLNAWGAQAAPGLRIPVDARFGAESVRCGQRYAAQGRDQRELRFADLRFYLSEFAWVDAQGREHPLKLQADATWQQADAALLDFEDGSANCQNGTPAQHREVQLLGQPGPDWRGLRFTLGLPAALNHQDATRAKAPLNQSALFWSWQSGYRFLKLELDVQTARGVEGFPIHLGSTGCASADMRQPPSSCKQPNRVRVELAGFRFEADQILLQLDQLLAGVTLGEQTPRTAPGCMSAPDDPDCQGVFEALGLRGTAAQRVFVAAPR